MGRSWSAAILAVIVLMATLSPSIGTAASLPYSDHRLQLQTDPSPDEPIEGTSSPMLDDGRKNIGKGVMFSLIIPGAGQLYSGSWLRALPWFAVEVAGWALFANYHGKGQDKTDEFEAYAGPRRVSLSNSQQAQLGHFDVNAYLLREWQIASSPNYNTAPYQDNLDDWKTLSWSRRDDYLGNAIGFTHDVLTPDIQQYFEMIGKYINQFGFGWMDTYDPSLVNVNIQTQDHIWGLSGDDPSSVGFDGSTTMFYRYRDMRGEANDLLDKSNVAMEVVLVNHVLSALDAAFAVRSHNKRLEQGTLGRLKLEYEVKPFDGQLARFMKVSVPIN